MGGLSGAEEASQTRGRHPIRGDGRFILGMGLPSVMAVDSQYVLLPGWLGGGVPGPAGAVRRSMAFMQTDAETTQQETDEALFARVSRGDAEAFAAFYDRHESLFLGVAWRILMSDADAEDVLQEAAVLIWERAPAYDASLGRPLSWAVTLVRNKAIDRLRSLRRRSDLLARACEEAGEGEAAESGGGDVSAVASEVSGSVRQTLKKLPAEQREAIELAFFSGLTQSEIAEHLGQPLGTIKARIRRGMLAMRDALEGAL
jgi:RNA polymerase sigma-70 factor (ECF subfamily)